MESQKEEEKVSNEEMLKLLSDFATAIENAALQLKQGIGKMVEVEVTISEIPFLNLRWEKSRGAILKEYEFTSKVANSGSDDYYHCLKVLKVNKATINNRFHCKGWKYSYWLYNKKPDVIYRQLFEPNREISLLSK